MDKEIADKDTPGQDPDAQPMRFEIMDTPEPGPGERHEEELTPKLIFGKYKTMEEAEAAHKEAERKIHATSQEAAEYRKALMERVSAPTPSPGNAEGFEERLREELARAPGETIMNMIEFKARQLLEEQAKAQRETIRKIREYSQRPEYADIAQDAAMELSSGLEALDPVEVAFLKARIRKLESGNGRVAANPTFVEHGRGSVPAGTTRIELDERAARLRTAIPEDRMQKIAKNIAERKSRGLELNSVPISIEEWGK